MALIGASALLLGQPTRTLLASPPSVSACASASVAVGGGVCLRVSRRHLLQVRHKKSNISYGQLVAHPMAAGAALSPSLATPRASRSLRRSSRRAMGGDGWITPRHSLAGASAFRKQLGWRVWHIPPIKLKPCAPLRPKRRQALIAGLVVPVVLCASPLQYIKKNKADDNDWFKLESNAEGTK